MSLERPEECSNYRGVCVECGAPLIGGRKDRKFCDKTCAAFTAKRKWREANPKSPLAAFATGAVAEANEMLVAIDLLQRGYEVYRSAFPAQSCDMLVRTPDAPADYHLRIEVTSGNYTGSGTLVHPERDPSKYDVMAVVANGKITYKPEL